MPPRARALPGRRSASPEPSAAERGVGIRSLRAAWGYALCVRTAAILPVKRFRAAKQRLGASVGEKRRAELARAMVADVLGALARSASLQLLIVVTDEPSVAMAAREQGAVVLADTADAGQSTAVEIGVRHALAEGIERVLCVPGDCPALDPRELEQLLRRGRGSS